MRVSQVLASQHIGWHFQQFWRTQGKRKIVDTGAAKILEKRGILVRDPHKELKEKYTYEKIEVVGYIDKPQAFDNTHPNWHSRPLLTYNDNNVLLEGLAQAKILTNSVEVKQGLPDAMELPKITKDFNRKVKDIILSTVLFDAEQKKLPKIKDSERPAWNFPRTYGITQPRVHKLLITKLLSLIEKTSSQDLVKNKYVSDDLYFSFPFERFGENIQFQLLGDIVLTSSEPLSVVSSDSTSEFELPDLAPIKPTISLTPENIYVMKDVYSIERVAIKRHPHTLFVNFNKETVKNLYEEEVTAEQIYGRSLLKTFTAAAAYAKQTYGTNVKELPTPVVLQCIQSDGRLFYFGLLQLNTLDLESINIKNVWFQTPGLPLYEKCVYEVGRPVLHGYNDEVVRHFVAFYSNT
ncbi:large ribosomal subunit protein mL37 [Cylas formicarius]|uniref:large ribosomal subunit protein mL37 n=1 Tax=Cylas formicarius TaxID=197179 RepID=UPI0029589E5C|nr:large ribosomal subunit protein mL37 [Cylas formicarius]